jgi:hypothetical protein
MKKTIKLAPHPRFKEKDFGFADNTAEDRTGLVCCREVLEKAFPKIANKKKVNLTISSKPFRGSCVVQVETLPDSGAVNHLFNGYAEHIYFALQREILPLLDPNKSNQNQTIYFRACVRKEKVIS